MARFPKDNKLSIGVYKTTNDKEKKPQAARQRPIKTIEKMITITKFYGNGKRTVERLDSNVPKRSKTNVEEHNDVPCCSSTPVQPYRTVRGIPHDDEVLHDSDRDTEGLPSDSESEDSVFESYLSFHSLIVSP